MSDARHPVTAEFVAAEHHARALRPADPRARVAPEDFVAYREAVAAAEAGRCRHSYRQQEAAVEQGAGVGPGRVDEPPVQGRRGSVDDNEADQGGQHHAVR